MTTPQVYNDDYFSDMRKAEHEGRPEDFAVHRTFFEALGEQPLGDLRVLDIGCGKGELLVLLRKQKVGDVVGLDFSPSAVRSSRERLSADCGTGLDDTVLQGSVADRSLFVEGRFDLVFMTDVVEHLPPEILEQGLANVRHWLSDRGRLLVHTFPTLGPHKMAQLYLRLIGSTEYLALLNSVHCNVQTRRSLGQALQHADLHCERMWLVNDILMTSTWYHTMSPARQKIARTLVDGILRSKPVEKTLGVLGLAEWAKPSIYCVCTKGSSPSAYA